MIPKIIHQIWIGDKSIPIEFIEFSNEWKKMYPDFEYVLWGDQQDLIPVDLIKYYTDDSFPLAFKADLLRYHIIQKYGGVYLDMDNEPLKKMDNYIFNDLSFFSGIQGNGEVAIGVFGAEPKNDLINKVCNNVLNNINYILNLGIDKNIVNHLTGPVYFNQICNSYKDNPHYKFFDSKYFYPYWFTETHRRNEDFKKTSPDSYSVHHWSNSWK